MLKTLSWMSSFLILPFVLTAPTVAQSITAASDGTGTVITIDGNTYEIQGGTQAGANLFHSFQALGLNSGEIANFLSNPSITNILGRVTGGDPSIINGLIQVTGANSHLYLMNPAGFVFGAGASLNVGGDFFATTSDRIGFDGGWFNATGANDYAGLIGTPNQFAFASTTPSAILNFGDLTTETNMSLVGGTMLNQGSVTSTQGKITIAAVPGERFVTISEPGMLLSLDLPTDSLTAGITPVDLPTLLTGSGRDNPPVVAPNSAGVSTGALPLQNGDVAIAGQVSGQQVDLYAAGQVKPTDADLIEGDTRVVRFSETGENPNQALFIDHRVDHPEQLLYGAAAGTVSQIIENDENGVSVISEQLAEISTSVGELESVAIVAEGNQGNFWLGSEWIRSENIGDYTAQLQTWGEALTTNADILLYSCFTALGATGEALVQTIADITRADVAVSVNATGSRNYGGDWTLETHIGAVEAANPFTGETLMEWDGKLSTRTVTSLLDDSSGGTLREEIAAAGAGDLITFGVVGTVTLNGTQISWGTDNLTIDGNGSVVDGNNTSRVFQITANNATIQDLTIQNGSTSGIGGGIFHSGNGTLTLNNVKVLNNSANNGGGMRSNGSVVLRDSTVANNSASSNWGGMQTNDDVTLINSTVSGNSAGNNGGGFFSNGNTTLTSSTVSGNTAGNNGGGFFSNGNTTLTNATIAFNTAVTGQGGGFYISGITNNTITNTIIANNTAAIHPEVSANLSTSIVQHSLITDTIGITGLTLTNGVNGNIIGQDPQLGPLQNNGGPTATHTVLPGSPTINAGNNALAPGVDQTGNPRIFDSTVDIGAYELQIITSTDSPDPDNNLPKATSNLGSSCDLTCVSGPASIEPEPVSELTNLLVLDIEGIEVKMTKDYATLVTENDDLKPLTIAQAQTLMNDIEQQTGVRPAVIYFTFVPSSVTHGAPGVGATPNATDALQLILVPPVGAPIVERPLGVTRAHVDAQTQPFRWGIQHALNEDYRQPAQQLYDWLIRPLQPHLQDFGIEHLAIVADEGLRSLPMAAFHDGEDYLIEHYSLGLLPSISLIDWRYRPLHNATALAMGASTFKQQPSLPGVPLELSVVTKRPEQQYLDDAFTYVNLRSQAQKHQFQILHLATHSSFRAGEVDAAYIQLWDEEELKLKNLQEFELYREPPIELLVLSACETAIGDVSAELGFAGAALQVGVKSVLASLWQVSDLGTLALMDSFYEQIADPTVTIKAEALRQAQLELLRGNAIVQDGRLGDITLPPALLRYRHADLSHPYYWSAFTLVGSPW